MGIHATVAFAFVRITTRRGILATPLTVEEAFAYLDNWLSFPCTQFTASSAEDLLKQIGLGGNIVTDAQTATAAIRLKSTVHSADSDFERFPGLKWKNPLS